MVDYFSFFTLHFSLLTTFLSQNRFSFVYYYVESIFLYSMQSQEQQLLMELRNLTLSHQEKRLIRQRIQTKQQKSLNIQKVFRALKYTGYASVGIFGLFVLASSFLPQQQRISDSTNPLITLLTP